MSGSRAPAFWLRATVPLALMTAIFYLSAQSDPGPELPAAARVLAHFSEYALLALAWAWALRPVLARSLLAAAAVALLYAASDEYHQSFVPGRETDPLDLLVDTAGVLTAAWLIARRQNHAKERAQEER